jgi:hypothetical protein
MPTLPLSAILAKGKEIEVSAHFSQPEPHGIPKGHAYFVTDGSDGRWGKRKKKGNRFASSSCPKLQESNLGYYCLVRSILGLG